MRRLFVLNSIFMAVLMTASIARAAECTIERDVLGTALRQASSCVRAYRVFEACSFRSKRRCAARNNRSEKM
jgi:hypothetical protein